MNGDFDCSCYHPNFLLNQRGMLERCALRNGNVHSADGWRDVLDPVIARAIIFQLAEVAVTGPMVRAILAAIRRLRAPPLSG